MGLNELKKPLIVSGGSGSLDIISGLWREYGIMPDSLINLYDDGKSTGIVRDIAGTLGPSDMRKIHRHKYFLINGNDSVIELYDLRLSGLLRDAIIKGDSIISGIGNTGLRDLLLGGLHAFSEQVKSKKKDEMQVNDFSLMNCVYAGLFIMLGPQRAADELDRLLHVKSRTFVSSDEKLWLGAITASGSIINSEAGIVSHGSTDIIESIFFHDKEGTKDKYVPKASKQAIGAIRASSAVIISPGTVWSSIIPTLVTSGISAELNEKEHAYCVINAGEDYDTKGFSQKDYYNLLKRFLPPNFRFIASDNIGENDAMQCSIASGDTEKYGGREIIDAIRNYRGERPE